LARKDKNTPTPICFDEAKFDRAYRRREAPSQDLVSDFHNADPRDGAMVLRVLNRVRADAATGPGGILAMFAIALTALALMTTIALTVTAESSSDSWKVAFGTSMVVLAVAFTVFGVWFYVWQSARHRCANMWKAALEAS
jgi:sterol desaturase/sphingolipid hydroxylase (fatty acid hydroxylase superfamily)